MSNNYLDNFYGEIPDGVSIYKNIDEAKKYAVNHSFDEILIWFKNKVQNKGEWDYKQLDKENATLENRDNKYEAFGNWNYGVVGTALGIPKAILLSAAGGAQMSSEIGLGSVGFIGGSILDFTIGSLVFLATGFLYPSSGFGLIDDPKDTANILMGIEAHLFKNFVIIKKFFVYI